MKFTITLLATLLAATSSLLADVQQVQIKDFALNVKIDREDRCIFGDLDAIKYEFQELVKKGKPAKVIVALEALNADRVITKTFVDSAKPDAGDAKFQFDLKEFPKGPVALSVCSDVAGTGRCSDKPGAEYSKIFPRYQFKNDPQTGKPVAIDPGYLNKDLYPEDKVYFISVLNLDQNLSFHKPLLVKDIPTVVQPISNPEKANKTKELISNLGSLPLSVNDSGLIINLPAFSQAKCTN